MTEETKNHISSILEELKTQRVKVAALIDEAMQDYNMATEIRDLNSLTVASREMERYSDAYSAIRKAMTILRIEMEGGKIRDDEFDI